MTSTHPASQVVRWLPYIVAATFFMEYLDTTIIATALPQMARSFGVGPNAVSLGVTAYMLALAVFIPVSGWIADRFGSRTIYAGAIIVFTLASVLCGLSNTVFEFTVARVLQGLGGALMVPVGRLIVVRATEKSKLIQAIATITWPAIAAPVIGPPIGGFITTYASWRWIFLLNVPFGIGALIAVALMVRNVREDKRKPFDVIGFVLSGCALTSVLYGTELASQPNSNVALALGFVVAGCVCGYLAFRHAAGHPHPLIDYTTLKVPTFSVTVITGSATRIGLGAVPYLMPLLFQIGFGMTAFHSGLLMLATAIGNFGMKAVTTRILMRYGFKRVAIVDVAICGVSIIVCGMLTPLAPLAWVLFVIFVYGCTRSMQFSTLSSLAYADIRQEQMSGASTLWSSMAQMTVGMGIAFGAVSLRAATWINGHPAHQGIDFTLGDFRLAFLFAGILTLVSLIGYYGLAADAGRNIGGGTRRSTA